MSLWSAPVDRQVLTAAAVIYDDSGQRVKVFLARRAANRRFLPGVYELPGGHVRFGEHIETSLQRQIKEKLHVEVQVGEPVAVFDYLNSRARQHVAEIVYLCQLHDFQPREIMLKRDKYAESIWVGMDTVEKQLAEMKIYSPAEYAAVIQALVRLEQARRR